MSKAERPQDRYRALIARGEIADDPAQHAAVAKLTRLHAALSGYRPPSAGTGWTALLHLFVKRRPAPSGLYIHGGVGRGKSMLMDMFFETVPVEKKRRLHFHEFMQEAHALINRLRSTDREAGNGTRSNAPKNTGGEPIGPAAATLAARNWLLCFDEFEVRDIADAMIVSRLFGAMFDLGVVVVATSNRHPDDLYRGGLQRERFLPFIDVLKERLEVVHLAEGRDYRLQRLEELGVYHVPLNPASGAALDAVFAELTDGADGAPDIVLSGGREIAVPCACGPVARFSFADLCEAPLGPGDYLAIAKSYRSVIVAGVPMMDEGRRDSARRFMTLIDTLYDNNTHLVLSAAAEPGALYAGGAWGFEFERTISRLMEMRSQEYVEATRRSASS